MTFLLWLTLVQPGPVLVPHPVPPTWQLCWDHDGVNTEGFLIAVDGVRIADVRPVRAAQSPSYCVPVPSMTPGPHALTVTAYNLTGRAPESDALSVLLISVPTRATGLLIRPSP